MLDFQRLHTFFVLNHFQMVSNIDTDLPRQLLTPSDRTHSHLIHSILLLFVSDPLQLRKEHVPMDM